MAGIRPDPLIATIFANAMPAEEAAPGPKPQELAALLQSLSTGQVPANFNISALMQETNARQQELEAQALQTQQILASVVARNELGAAAIRTRRDQIVSQTAELAAAQNAAIDTQTDVELATIADIGATHADLRDRIDSHNAEISADDAVYNSIKARMLESYEAINTHNEKSLIDLIRDPGEYFNTLNSALAAENQIKLDSRQATELAAIQQYEAAAMQSSSAMSLTKTQLQNSDITNARLRTSLASNIASKANTARSFSLEAFELDTTILGIDDASAKTLTSSLNALAEQARLGHASVNNAIQLAQLQTAQAQVAELQRLAEKEITTDAELEAVYQELKEAYPAVAPESYSAYTALLKDNTIDPDTHRLVTMYMSNRLLSTANVLNSSAPHANAVALLAAGKLPPGMADITTGIELLATNDGTILANTPAYEQATPDEQALMRDQRMLKFMAEIKENANGVFTNRIPGVNLISPDAMDFSDPNMPAIPVAGVELIKKWHLDTTNYDSYLRGAMAEAEATFIEAVGLKGGYKAKQSPEEVVNLIDTLATTMAGVNQYYLNNAQTSLGVSLPGLNSPLLRLGNRDTINRDTTNPEMWKYYFTSRFASHVVYNQDLLNQFRDFTRPRTVAGRGRR